MGKVEEAQTKAAAKAAAHAEQHTRFGIRTQAKKDSRRRRLMLGSSKTRKRRRKARLSLHPETRNILARAWATPNRLRLSRRPRRRPRRPRRRPRRPRRKRP